MSKVVTFAVAVVLLVGSSALANGALDQMQNTIIGLANTIALTHGSQGADSIQNLAVANSQNADGPCYTSAHQAFIGNLAEIAHAWGDCGLITISQGLATTGDQVQFVGEVVDPKSEAQILGLLAEQSLTRQDGPGGANAMHQIVLKEDQDASNAAGSMSESSAILGLQSADLVGEAAATGAVQATMSVVTTQQQSSM